MYELKPKNKQMWLKDLSSEPNDKIGSLYVPPSAQNATYRLATVLGLDESCDEAKGISLGDTVLYDTLGANDHRIGNAMYRTVLIRSVVAVVAVKLEEQKAPPESVLKGAGIDPALIGKDI